jgi:hypothetical protein
MNSATFKFKVEGSDYQNLQDKVKKELAGFIEIDLEDLNKYVNYELDISAIEKTASTYSYSALVTARLKNV